MAESRLVDPPWRTERLNVMGQVVLVLSCPFCECVTEVYLWSLAGSGKRCDCGAKFEISGGRGSEIVAVKA